MTLIVWADNPERIIRELASLTRIGDYQLLPKEIIRIHDFYLDTSARALQTQELNLRLRKTGERYRITLKGPRRVNNWGIGERFEVEEIWSKATLKGLISELANRNIDIQLPYQSYGYGNPLEVLTCLGFKVVQHRENFRRVRSVVITGDKWWLTRAELAIDSVVYHFEQREICLYEVEIEAKCKDSSLLLRNLADHLAKKYGPALRRWNYGKLKTGEAIEKLLNNGALKGLVNANRLSPVAYERIHEYLERKPH